jgi:hypothetical protein
MTKLNAVKLLLCLAAILWFPPLFANEPTLVTGGRNITTLMPSLAVSHDEGKTWNEKILPGLFSRGEFEATTCTGSGERSTCLAAGLNYPLTARAHALLYLSKDRGDSWHRIDIPNLPADVEFNTASCTGTGNHTLCLAAGDVPSTQTPTLVVSMDRGETWSLKSIANLPPITQFKSSSCTGEGVNAVCAIAGTSAGNLPVLVTTTDGGETWTLKIIEGMPKTAHLGIGVSCTGSGSKAVCTAIGSQPPQAGNQPVIVVSNDGANTWSFKTISNKAPQAINLQAVNCSGGDKAICSIAGTSKNFTPKIIVSTDNGDSWDLKSIADSNQHGNFSSISCSGSGADAVCVAAADTFMAVSSKGGESWIAKPLPMTCAKLYAVTCNEQDGQTNCVSVGSYDNGDELMPLIITSKDSGLKWQSEKLPTGYAGVLYDAGVSH